MDMVRNVLATEIRAEVLSLLCYKCCVHTLCNDVCKNDIDFIYIVVYNYDNIYKISIFLF